MPPEQIEQTIREILGRYQGFFNDKTYAVENDDHDVLMDVFGITPTLKRENRQYWGRELGMCWQRIVTELFRLTCSDFKPALAVGDDEPCDCIVGKDAIDTKYRIGSGDSGTLKKFKQYGKLLSDMGLNPILLMVRSDNLSAAIAACKVGGRTILQKEESFSYIKEKSGFDLYDYLQKLAEGKDFCHKR